MHAFFFDALLFQQYYKQPDTCALTMFYIVFWAIVLYWEMGYLHGRFLITLCYYMIFMWCYLTISSSVSPFSYAFNLSQHQGLFQWVGSAYQVAKVLELQFQHQSFQWIFRVDFLWLTALILQSKGLSRVFSSTTVWKHQFFSIQPSFWSTSNICTRLLGKP